MTTALIYGATGLTGTLVTRALIADGVDVRIAGRDRARLDALASRVGGGVDVRCAQVHDRAALVDAMRGADAVVNCAGPFTLLGEPVVRAAIEAGAHYLDTTGEQLFMRDIYERCESAARHAGVAVVNGFAFEIALADWAAHVAAEALGVNADEPAKEVMVAYAVDGFAPSAGTRLSAIESLASPGCVWEEDRWEPVATGAERRTVSFAPSSGAVSAGDTDDRSAVSFPSGEVITVPRHVATRRVQTFISLERSGWASRITSLIGGALPALMKSPLGSFARARVGGSAAEPTAEQRAASLFSIAVEVSRGFERTRVAISGADPYGLTAAIAAYGVARIGAGHDIGAGVLAPSEAFDPGASLTAIARRWNLDISRSFGA